MAVDEWLGWVGVKMKDPYQKHPKTSKNQGFSMSFSNFRGVCWVHKPFGLTISISGNCDKTCYSALVLPWGTCLFPAIIGDMWVQSWHKQPRPEILLATQTQDVDWSYWCVESVVSPMCLKRTTGCQSPFEWSLASIQWQNTTSISNNNDHLKRYILFIWPSKTGKMWS
jgi:hypothetical protein